VLDIREDRALIITEDIIEKRAYHYEFVYVERDEAPAEATWETCDLRKYLNSEFLDKFDSSKIVPTTNINPDNPWYGTNGGNPATDKIFLLSLDEVVEYFGDSGDLKSRKGWYWEHFTKRKKLLKDGHYVLEPKGNHGWAECKGFFINDQYNSVRIAKFENAPFRWWLRSPGDYNTEAAYVGGGSETHDGVISVVGGEACDICGIRPALWVKLKGEN
jgi:hypothetical protein